MKVRLYNQINNSKYHPILSLKCAISGLFLAFKNERNLVVQLVIGISSFVFNILFGQYILAIANLVFMAVVISFEIINTVVENLCDLVDINFNLKIKVIKDMSAGAVLMIALVWLLILILGLTKVVLRVFFGFNFDFV